MTGQQMCEYIADWMYEKHGIIKRAEDIWNMSPSGELWPVYSLYMDAKCDREGLSILMCHKENGEHEVGDLIYVSKGESDYDKEHFVLLNG